MKRYWTFHWQKGSWRTKVNREGPPVRSSGSNMFKKRGVSPGHVVYVITLADGLLYMGGRMTVERIVSRAEAVRILGNPRLYPAKEWVIGSEVSGTPLNLHRRLSPALSKRLRFRSPDGKTRGLYFVEDDRLYSQATRGLQELTPESASLLDQILQATDPMGIPDEFLTVTEELLENSTGTVKKGAPATDTDYEPTADLVELERRVSRLRKKRIQSVPPGQAAPASALTTRKSFLRDPAVTAWVLQNADGRCEACGSPAPFAGDAGEPFLEMHHVRQLASGGSDRVSNAVAVCPNCHRRCHHGQDRGQFTEGLYRKLHRLVRE